MVVEAEPAGDRELAGSFGRSAPSAGQDLRFGEAMNDSAAALSAEVSTAPMDRRIPALRLVSANAFAPYGAP
ncbi:hypothetical protein OHA17_38420 [Streptomyces sp. NBC_00212]